MLSCLAAPRRTALRVTTVHYTRLPLRVRQKQNNSNKNRQNKKIHLPTQILVSEKINSQKDSPQIITQICSSSSDTKRALTSPAGAAAAARQVSMHLVSSSTYPRQLVCTFLYFIFHRNPPHRVYYILTQELAHVAALCAPSFDEIYTCAPARLPSFVPTPPVTHSGSLAVARVVATKFQVQTATTTITAMLLLLPPYILCPLC